MEFHSMVGMARSPEEVKAEAEKFSMPSAASPKGPVYPYGLCLRLDEECLDKLGIDGDLPSIGDMVHLIAMAEVTSARQEKIRDADGNEKVCRCIELQITHLSAEDEDDEDPEERRERQEARDNGRRSSFYEDDEDGEV
jgi:hypothetical protein